MTRPACLPHGHRVQHRRHHLHARSSAPRPRPPRSARTSSRRRCSAWNPVSDAGYYIVYVYNDRSMTNEVASINETAVYGTHVDAADDAAARQPGRHGVLLVRPSPCKAPGRCSKDPRGTANSATHAFDKRSNPISGLEERIHDTSSVLTGDVPEFDDEVVFSWDDYLDTNQAGNDLDVTAMPSTVEAHTYRVQISTSDSFPSTSATTTSPSLDQTSYTRVVQDAARGSAVLAGAGDRRRRQRAGLEPEQEPDRQRPRDQEGLPRPVAGRRRPTTAPPRATRPSSGARSTTRRSTTSRSTRTTTRRCPRPTAWSA